MPAPESDVLSLSPAPETSPVTSPSLSGASKHDVPAPAAVASPPVSPSGDIDTGNQSIYLASGSASALGLNDNLLLGGLVAVFALAVIGLVSAGGHRGSWRRH